MRRNTSGPPAADPADNSGLTAGIIGMPATCRLCVRDSALPRPMARQWQRDAIRWPRALAGQHGAAAIPRETGFNAGTTLAVP
jgi:hypothetical protein